MLAKAVPLLSSAGHLTHWRHVSTSPQRHGVAVNDEEFPSLAAHQPFSDQLPQNAADHFARGGYHRRDLLGSHLYAPYAARLDAVFNERRGNALFDSRQREMRELVVRFTKTPN